jgi:hypothetical protein
MPRLMSGDLRPGGESLIAARLSSQPRGCPAASPVPYFRATAARSAAKARQRVALAACLSASLDEACSVPLGWCHSNSSTKLPLSRVPPKFPIIISRNSGNRKRPSVAEDPARCSNVWPRRDGDARGRRVPRRIGLLNHLTDDADRWHSHRHGSSEEGGGQVSTLSLSSTSGGHADGFSLQSRNLHVSSTSVLICHRHLFSLACEGGGECSLPSRCGRVNG